MFNVKLSLFARIVTRGSIFLLVGCTATGSGLLSPNVLDAFKPSPTANAPRPSSASAPAAVVTTPASASAATTTDPNVKEASLNAARVSPDAQDDRKTQPVFAVQDGKGSDASIQLAEIDDRLDQIREVWTTRDPIHTRYGAICLAHLASIGRLPERLALANDFADSHGLPQRTLKYLAGELPKLNLLKSQHPAEAKFMDGFAGREIEYAQRTKKVVDRQATEQEVRDFTNLLNKVTYTDLMQSAQTICRVLYEFQLQELDLRYSPDWSANNSWTLLNVYILLGAPTVDDAKGAITDLEQRKEHFLSVLRGGKQESLEAHNREIGERVKAAHDESIRAIHCSAYCVYSDENGYCLKQAIPEDCK